MGMFTAKTEEIPSMRMYDIIMKKRNGGELSREEIDFFIEGYTKEKFPTIRCRR